jgi:hypothetical protein
MINIPNKTPQLKPFELKAWTVEWPTQPYAKIQVMGAVRIKLLTT